MKVQGDTITLSTGTTFYANYGILGLTDGCTHIFEGYDGDISCSFTEAERQEIADYMSAL